MVFRMIFVIFKFQFCEKNLGSNIYSFTQIFKFASSQDLFVKFLMDVNELLMASCDKMMLHRLGISPNETQKFYLLEGCRVGLDISSSAGVKLR